MSSSPSSGADSQSAGIGTSRRSGRLPSELVRSKVSQPWSKPPRSRDPADGMVLHTRHDCPELSTNSR